jgi:hypothetical protein
MLFVLLSLTKCKHLGPSFKKTKAFIYKQCKKGFYVYAKPQACNPNIVASYIGRYLGRPVIANSRIDDYDGDFITFHYNRHEDDVLVTEKIPVLDFIQRLIQHIPQKHFKMIRYYGIYARHRKEDKRLFRAISKQKHTFLVSLNRWRHSILRSFGYDPLQCPHCRESMTFISIYYKKQPISLDELFKKVMNDFKHYT